MKTNAKVIDDFIHGIEFSENKSLRVGTGARKLFSYNTCICQRVGDDNFYYNDTRYSNTTSKHQYLLRKALEGFKNVITVTNIPINSLNLK